MAANSRARDGTLSRRFLEHTLLKASQDSSRLKNMAVSAEDARSFGHRLADEHRRMSKPRHGHEPLHRDVARTVGSRSSFPSRSSRTSFTFWPCWHRAHWPRAGSRPVCSRSTGAARRARRTADVLLRRPRRWYMMLATMEVPLVSPVSARLRR